jgi:hypothetical protein
MEQERFAKLQTIRSLLGEMCSTPIPEWLRLFGTADRATKAAAVRYEAANGP